MRKANQEYYIKVSIKRIINFRFRPHGATFSLNIGNIVCCVRAEIDSHNIEILLLFYIEKFILNRPQLFSYTRIKPFWKIFPLRKCIVCMCVNDLNTQQETIFSGYSLIWNRFVVSKKKSVKEWCAIESSEEKYYYTLCFIWKICCTFFNI